MAGSTSKKVVVYRFDREALAGFVNPQSYQAPEGAQLLSLNGTLATIPWEDIKAVCFVRDLDASPPAWEKRIFTTRPKSAGIWVRMRLRDGEELDGLLPNNLLPVEPWGFTVVPPDPSSNSQKLFIPRKALLECRVAGVVGSPVRFRRKPKPAVPKAQLEMFE